MAREIRLAIDLTDYHLAGDSLIEQCKDIPLPCPLFTGEGENTKSAIGKVNAVKKPPTRIRTPRRRTITLPRKPVTGR